MAAAEGAPCVLRAGVKGLWGEADPPSSLTPLPSLLCPSLLQRIPLGWELMTSRAQTGLPLSERAGRGRVQGTGQSHSALQWGAHLLTVMGSGACGGDCWSSCWSCSNCCC